MVARMKHLKQPHVWVPLLAILMLALDLLIQ